MPLYFDFDMSFGPFIPRHRCHILTNRQIYGKKSEIRHNFEYVEYSEYSEHGANTAYSSHTATYNSLNSAFPILGEYRTLNFLKYEYRHKAIRKNEE